MFHKILNTGISEFTDDTEETTLTSSPAVQKRKLKEFLFASPPVEKRRKPDENSQKSGEEGKYLYH